VLPLTGSVFSGRLEVFASPPDFSVISVSVLNCAKKRTGREKRGKIRWTRCDQNWLISLAVNRPRLTITAIKKTAWAELEARILNSRSQYRRDARAASAQLV
jgi:hypothetical protein